MDSPHQRISFFCSMHGKLLIHFLPLSLIPLVVVSLLAYFQARNALQQAASDKLEAVRAIKKFQIESYLAERESAAQATADLVNMLRQQAFARLEALRDAKRSAIVHLFQEWQADVVDMATNPDIAAGAAPLSAGFKGLGADRVRALYLDKPDLEDAGDKSAYSVAHAGQHRFLAGHIEIHGYEDVLLIDPAGTVVYTVKKGGSLGRNLAANKDSSLNTLYQQLKSAQPGQTALADMALLDGQVAMFMGAPIYDGTTHVGVLVYQLPFRQVDEIMQVPDDMKLIGETYLVGPDKRMRSQSTLDPVNRSVVASLTGSVEKNGVDTPGSRAALAGSSGVDMLLNPGGIHSVCAYAPLEVPGLNWAIMVEESVAEAIVPQVEGAGMYILTQYAQRYGYQDVLLMAQDGYVFHTVMRGPDYQTNLLTGPYQNTHLGRLVQKVVSTGELGFADFAPYLPAGNKPVAYVAAPVMYQNKPEMVVALQLPPGWTDTVMQERTGMGETGETLLVGPDMRMRSNSYLDPAEHSVEASFVGTVQKNGMDNKAVREALAGKTGEEVQFDTDYRGHQVIITYAPVKFGKLNWALIAKQDVAEAFILVDRLTLVLLLVIGIATAFVIPVTLWTAGRLADPVLKLTSVAQAVAAGNLEVEVQVENSPSDELGILATAFKSMTRQLQDLIGGLEENVRERTAELEAANKELEAFSYSVSHDLRAPLRAIDGYTRILVEDYEAGLDAEGKRVCAVIRHQTQHMGQLIDDLLAFSRLGRTQIQAAPINMETLAATVFDELTTPEEQERIDFHLVPLPPALGDPTMIRQVWINLLSNAIKFSAKRERALIEVDGQQSEGEIIYSVHDNGAGFDMRYVDKLFGVFQRLHSEREFEGTGVGLAIVQRVIRRHSGRVWAEGAVDQGATFYFTLPGKGDW
ncbi:MAG: HAMP domain-containing protein [Anaerolineales bacterium]|nr:HAMP domain-containing protein [Anaerolineales bacterium]